MMLLSTELPVFIGVRSMLRPASHPCPCSSTFFHRRNFFLSSGGVHHSTNTLLNLTVDCSLTNAVGKAINDGDFWNEYAFVEVIGIGSRKEAVLDFCLESSPQSSSLRFWNIVMYDSLKVQLLQRSIEKDFAPRTIDVPLSLQSCSKAVILVVSAGYGLDYSAAVDILRTIKSSNGFAVTIILIPFAFEGKKRQDEVKNLIGKLKEHTSLLIDIDPDKLLEKDLVTLDDALRSANNAVFLALNLISIIKSVTFKKFIDEPYNDVKEIGVVEVIKILENHKEGKIGFGAGYNFRTSILQTIYDCPFLSVHLKNLKGVVLCIIASSHIADDSDKNTFLKTFREVTGYMGTIILSVIQDVNLEPNLLMTTVLIVGSTDHKASKSSSILSKLVQRFPFVFNILRKSQVPYEEDEEGVMIENENALNGRESLDPNRLITKISPEGVNNDFDHSTETDGLKTTFNGTDESYSSSDFEQPEAGGLLETDVNSLHFNNAVSKGTPLRRDPLGPGYQIAQKWAKERAADSKLTPVLNSLSIFNLPVGVRPSEDSEDRATQCSGLKSEQKSEAQVTTSRFSSWNSLTDASFEVIKEFYDTSSTFLKGKPAEIPNKQGLLSVRASSMLEAERDSQKKWSPVVEMQYRGSIYRGRCQGGLPEGKGRLVLQDGSIYDGMWRNGMRSGQGTFYFNNGDMFQGSWRDDVMHGKGWFYFHTGDRWFANFWKGKAYGEGRFYSKSGDVIFGHFQDGWRHGDFLCINVDGSRHVEVWNEGFLIRHEKLDSGSNPA